MGHYAITLQWMLGTMMTFSIIFMLFAYTFGEILYRMVNRGQVECNSNFSTVLEALYSTFLVTINLLDFTAISSLVSETDSIPMKAIYIRRFRNN